MPSALNDPLSVTRENVRWDERFPNRPGVADRRRDYEAQQAAQDEADLQARAQFDPQARAYVFGREKLDMEQAKQKFEMANEAELHPLRLQNEAQQARTSAALERQRLAQEGRALKDAEDQATDTTGFVESLSQTDAKRGTPEYQAHVALSRLNHPAMKSEVFDDVWKTSTPDPNIPWREVADRQKAMQEAAGPNATVSVSSTGSSSITTRPEGKQDAPPTQSEILAKRAKNTKDIETTIKPFDLTINEVLGAKAVASENGIVTVTVNDGKAKDVPKEIYDTLFVTRNGKTEVKGDATASDKPKTVKQNGVTYTLGDDGQYH